MLKKETIDLIAKIAKVKPDELTAAIKDEKEVDFTIDDKLATFTETEVTQLKTNEYNSGKVKGVEMAVKEVKEELGLEFQGKSVKGLAEAAAKKAVDDAKISPDKKVTELTEKLATVQATATDLQAKLSEKESEVANVKLSTELTKQVPAGTTIDADEVIVIMKTKGYDFQMKDGKLIALKDGKEITDNLSNATPVKDVINNYVTERKLISEGAGDPAEKGGRGSGGGKAPVKYGKMSEIKKAFEAEGKSTLGTEFSEAVTKAAAENKEFAMDK